MNRNVGLTVGGAAIVIFAAIGTWLATAQSGAVPPDTPEPEASTGFKGYVEAIGGGPIANAAVMFRAANANMVTRLDTDKDGAFEVVSIQPGTYLLTVSAQGYRVRREISVTVVNGAVSPIDIKMRSMDEDMTSPHYRVVAAPQGELTERTLNAILNEQAHEGYILEETVEGADGKALLVFLRLDALRSKMMELTRDMD